MIVERAPATELIPRPLELLDAAAKQGRPLGVWSRATEAALVLGSGQHPPAGWSPPDGLPLARRGTGGGAVLCDEDYLMLDIALPAGDPRILDDVTETYRWLAERLVAALGRLGVDDLSLVDPVALRRREAPGARRRASRASQGSGPTSCSTRAAASSSAWRSAAGAAGYCCRLRPTSGATAASLPTCSGSPLGEPCRAG